MEERKRCDRAAFTAFVRDYRPEALKKAHCLTRNADDAHDLVQEATYRLMKYWDRYEPPRRISCLFAVIMRNAFLDKLRTRPRLRSLDGVDQDGWPYDEVLPHPEADVLDQLIRKETATKVRACLGKLRPSYRFVLRRADMEGCCYAEIAEELGVPMGTLKSRISRARASFRRHANGLAEIAKGLR